MTTRPTVIHILDENTANKIAAGEVVERPASVVKELVENALDAYGRTIEITIAEGGTELIRVTDDGVGMSAADAALAVLRHATSKIGSVDDLFSVHSLGFRGEALPSIASVSRFSLTTRLHTEDMATYVEVTGGEITDRREAGGGVGTVVAVADLFFNTPARRKFLKTPATESGYIHDIVGKLALSHPEVGFKLINNGRLVLATPGNGNLLDAMASLYGPKVAGEVLPVRYEEEALAVTGFVGKPTLLKSSRQWQTFTVNSRIITSRMIAKALDNAYHSLLPKAGYPLVVLNIAVPADTIDVNVHPQKSEVKFRDEGRIFKAVHRAVSEALIAADAKLTAGAATVELPKNIPGHYPAAAPTSSRPVYQDRSIAPALPPMQWQESPLPWSAARQLIREQQHLNILEPAPPAASPGEIPEAPPPFAAESPAEQASPGMNLIALGQIADCYIVARGSDGLYIVDQHAAHERILYDRLSLATGRIPVQTLLMPLFIDYDHREAELVNEHLEDFYQLGFTLEQVGPGSFRLTEMPADVTPGEARDFLHDILLQIQNTQNASAAVLRHACLQMAACRAAIKSGETLNMRQLQALLAELAATALPYTCPHGRPTIVKFGAEELAKMFKRT
ncbi:MAG TPA: DNA mismatch repair endonuclease MutL [Selenomonadales bacterium]|nr:DNA mismatch repair endonuclease MutL [Selenomonadales bacterium]